MTNAVARIGLLVNGTDVQHADFGIFLEIVSGLNETADVRGQDVTVPGLDGQIPRARRRHTRRIVLAGIVLGIGATEAEQVADFRANQQAFAALFDPAQDPYTVTATLEDGTTATITARPQPGGMWNEIEPSLYAEVNVELLSTDPDWVIGS